MKDLRIAAPLTVDPTSSGAWRRLLDYVALTKPRLNLLVIVTTAVGFAAAGARPLDLLALIQAVFGSALVAGGAAGLNQVYERHTDGLMNRTRHRPLPDGRLSVAEASVFSFALSAGGLVWLAVGTTGTAAAVAAATFVIYAWVYTPLKLRSSAATLVGAIPGALPPLIGWAATGRGVPPAAWTLFAIVFCWQIPHFYAIAWLYRDDYRKAGFPFLPIVDIDGRRTGRQAVVYSTLLLLAAMTPSVAGIAGRVYLTGAVVASLGLLALAVRFAGQPSSTRARHLFFGSLAYLPAIWILLIANRLP